MADPPVAAGAVKVTEALALPAVAVPIVGACGTVVAVILLESPDWIPTTPLDVTPVALNV
jgi:hypothetical protein